MTIESIDTKVSVEREDWIRRNLWNLLLVNGMSSGRGRDSKYTYKTDLILSLRRHRDAYNCKFTA